MSLKCFSSQFTLLTLKMIAVPLLHIHSPWLVVYMYPSLISIPHGLFPIHSSFQTIPYKYQTLACIFLSSIIIHLPLLYLSLLQKWKGLSSIMLRLGFGGDNCVSLSPMPLLWPEPRYVTSSYMRFGHNTQTLHKPRCPSRQPCNPSLLVHFYLYSLSHLPIVSSHPQSLNPGLCSVYSYPLV